MDQLRTYLESEDVVTARWLANTLSVKTPSARSLLAEFKKKHASEYKAFHLLVGQRVNNGGAVMIVVAEDQLEERKKSLQSVQSCDIYSLQRDIHSATLPGAKAGCVLQLYFADSSQEQELLRSSAEDADALLKNAAGCIKASTTGAAIKIRSASERAVYSGYSAPRPAASAPAYKPSATAKSSSGGSSSTSAPTETMKVSKSSTASAQSFFGASPAAGAKKAPAAKASKAKQGTLNASVSRLDTTGTNADAKSVQRSTTVGADDDEEDWDDGTGTSYKPNKDNLKSRKVAVGMPQGQGGLHQADVENMEEDENDKNSTTNATTGAKRHAVGSGAIDDWRDDDAEDGQPKKKRTKIKTVEKMLMDDRGYMITTLVEEEVTDDEDDVRAAAAQAKAQRLQAEKLKAAQEKSAGDDKEKEKADANSKAKGVKTAPKGKPQPANQKGMMSFFGKR